MSFNEIARTAADVAQVAAVGIGGTWAYIKFIRGRTFRRRGELAVRGSVLTGSGGRAILARVTFTNTGLSWMKFEAPEQKGVFLFELHASDWQPDLDENVSWGEDVMRSIVLRNHDWVEPGEMVADEILLPAGRGHPEPVAYQVVAKVTIRRRRFVFWKRRGPEWTARTVIPSRMLLGEGEVNQETVTAVPTVDRGGAV